MSLVSKERLTKKFIEGGLKESSAKSYASTLRVLFDRLESLKDADEKTFIKKLDMKEFEKVFGKLKPTTRRNYISAIISWMKVNNETETDLFRSLSKERDELHTVYERIINKGEKTALEKENWMEADELAQIFETRLLPFIERLCFDSVKKKSLDSDKYEPSEIIKIRDYIILSVYIYPFYDMESNFGVLRNDLPTLIYKPITGRKKKPEGAPSNNENYFISNGAGAGYFVMNDYKTSKSHGSVNIELPQLVSCFLKRWAIFMGLKDGDPLFPDLSKHGVTQILQKQMKRLGGKPVSTQMMRKIYITSKFGKEAQVRDEVAKNMMHTVETQGSVYTKK